MSDDTSPRPVSGDIMSGRRPERTSARPRAGEDVVDAQFESVGSSQQADAHVAQGGADAERPSGIGRLRGGRAPRAARGERAGPVFWIVGLALVLGAFWVSGGHALVLPHVITVASERGQTTHPLRIVNVTSKVERSESGLILLVDGEVANLSPDRQRIPSLAISVSGREGGIMRYFLGTSDRVLVPGERFAFSSRLAAPRNGVGSVTVDFERSDER